MFDILSDKIRNLVYKLEAKIERNKHGYVKTLPKDQQYFDGSMYDAIAAAATKYPTYTALDYFKTHISYHALIKKINRTAAALKASGVEKGDKVTVCMPNTPEAVYMFYAINEIGAVANMIHPLSSEKEIEDYVNRAQSKFILTIDLAYPKVESIIKNTPLEQVVVASAGRSMRLVVRFLYWLTKGRKNHVNESQQVLTWDTFLIRADRYHKDPYTEVSANDPAVILYSGGTTGKPKGVVLTNLNFNSQAQGAKVFGAPLLRPRYAMLCFLPNFHAFGLGMCTHMPLYYGMRLVLIPQFNAKKFKTYIKSYGINVIVGVPTAFEYLIKTKFGPHDLRDIKGLVSGGDVLSQAAKADINNFLKSHGCTKPALYTGYGLTEASGALLFAPAPLADQPDMVGYPLPDSEVMILDSTTGKEAAVGTPGEILVRGLTVMREYLDDPAETKNAFATVGHHRWLHTGDIGFMDEKGAVHFKARLKRMIITSGYNVYPTNVEETTLRCALVSKCACIGVPDKVRGQKVKIFVVLKPSASERAARKDLAKIYKQYLAKYEIPREIVVMDSLPMTKLGKIDYKALQ